MHCKLKKKGYTRTNHDMHKICHDASVSIINAEICIDIDSFCTNKHKRCIRYAYFKLCICAKKIPRA